MTLPKGYAKVPNKNNTLLYNRNLLLETESELKRIDQEITDKENKRRGKGTKIGAMLGLGIGIATAVPTFGASLFAGPAFGAAVGKWMGKKTGDDSLTRQELASRIQSMHLLRDSIALAEKTIEHLSEMEKKSINAYETKGIFDDDDYQCIKAAEESDYADVLAKLERVKPKMLKIPGFGRIYSDVIGRPASTAQAIKEVISDLESGVSYKQELALKRLYPLEQEINVIYYSKEIYRTYLQSNYPEVQAVALAMMVKANELRPNEKEFANIMERFLGSKNNHLIDATLFAIANTRYKSSTINYYLRKMVSPEDKQYERFRKKASDVLKIRYDQGFVNTVNVEQASQNILDAIIGNHHLKKQLKESLLEYYGSLKDISISGPAICFYLFGPPGTGKTTLISRLQEEINQDLYGIIRITMPEVKTLYDLLRQLENASPLQGKTIFFDEFQALDNIKPVEEQNKVIEFLKLLFENAPYYETMPKEITFATRLDAVGNNDVNIKNSCTLNFHNTIVAIATNIELSKLNCLVKQKNGDELRHKIESVSKPLKMASDLRDHIAEFVSKFFLYRFYKFTIIRHFEDNISITNRCQIQICSDLRNETAHLREVSGRDLTMKMVSIINTALTNFEDQNKTMLQRDDNGKIIQNLILDINNDEEYVVLIDNRHLISK